MTGGADPLEVARWWVKYGPSVGGKMRVGEALAKHRETVTLNSHAALHLQRLEAVLGKQRLSDLEAKDLAGWVEGLVNPSTGAPMRPYTRLHHFWTASRFFDSCVKQRWADHNPMATLKPPDREQEEIYVMPVPDARKLFRTAAGSIACGRLALEAFAGLRYTSAARIVKDDINFTERGIVMPGRKHKSGRRHYVEGYPANLWAWLKVAPDQCWSLTQRQYLLEKGRIFREAGLKPERIETEADRQEIDRLHNVLRHSFASYHVALEGDATRTAHLLTHRNQAMLYQHYRGRATRADAQAYFTIVPGQ